MNDPKFLRNGINYGCKRGPSIGLLSDPSIGLDKDPSKGLVSDPSRGPRFSLPALVLDNFFDGSTLALLDQVPLLLLPLPQALQLFLQPTF